MAHHDVGGDRGLGSDRSSLRPDGVVGMLRGVQQNHLQMSQMADQKASALLAASFVVLSIAVGQGSANGMSPSLIVMIVFTTVVAILAVRVLSPSLKPRVPGGRRNLLFFHDFVDLSADEYVLELSVVLDDEQMMHESMARDIHVQGQILWTRKFRLTAWAFRTFTLGVLATVVTFLIESAV